MLTLSKELPQFRNNGTDLQADFADYENWFSVNKYQSIILTRLELQEYNYISVGNYFFSNGELVYHLSLENSDLSLCPNNCNSLGVCQSSGSCYCYKDYIGPDCGIKADEITKNSQKILNLNRKIYYMYVDLLKIDGSIDIKIK